VNALDDPLVPLTHIATPAVTPAAAPPGGRVMNMRRLLPALGVGAVFETMTVRLALARRPAGSVAVAVSVWLPLATVVVFQLKLGLVPA
jgi:hypothetical protein